MHFLARCLMAIAVFFFLSGCSQRSSSDINSIPSPDGNLTLITSINRSKEDPTKYLCVKFQIVDSTGKMLYEEQTGASDRMRWSMRWEDNQRVVLDSSDIGTIVWEQQADESWHKVP